MATNTKPTSSTTAGLNVDLRTVSDQSAGSTVTQVVRQVMVLGDPGQAPQVANVVQGAALGNEYGLCVALMPHSPDLEDIKQLLLQILDELREQTAASGAGVSQDPVNPVGS